MATRVLIINRQLVFAVTLKQALEQTGAFDAHPFTTADAAFDFLREHPQDVALVDFTLPGRSGVKIIQQLRAIQPDLAVIISPRQPEAEALMSSLNLQGMMDMPFSARDVIPVIEQAVNPEAGATSRIQTRQLDDLDEPSGQITTKPLAEEDQFIRRQFGTTRLFESEAEAPDDAPAQMPNQENEPPSIKPLRRDADKTPTIKPLSRSSQARDLDEPDHTSDRTRDLDDDAVEATPAPSEVSSLESVLLSFGFDPPVSEEDTPSVPTKDSDALRQFLATTSRHDEPGDRFDDVLEAIDPENIDDAASARNSTFEGLVQSMRSDERYRTLPDRQQNLMDFILTSGMDAVLQEIEKARTGPIGAPPPPDTIPEEPSEQKDVSVFQKLAAEEPPPPIFEESGTIGDLMLGVSDTGFRNVLSLLRGEEVDTSDMSTAEREKFPAFFAPPPAVQMPPKSRQRPTTPPAKPAPPETNAYPFDDYLTDEEAEEATVAQVILQTTMEDVQLAEGFSLNQLLHDIENRLTLNNLSVKPLPSWDMDSGVFRPVSEADIREPDFLPEELPPGEVIEPSAALEFDEPESYTGRTTRPSASNQELLQTFSEEQDTLFDSAFIEEHAPVPPVEEIPPPESPPDEETQPPELPEESIPTSAFIGRAEEDMSQPTEDMPSFLSPLLEGQPPLPETMPEEVVETDWSIQAEETAFGEDEDWALPPRDVDDWEITEETPQISEPPADDAWQLTPVEVPPVADTPEEVVPEDPYIAQLALNLTQFSLESSSEASVLTRGGEIVAFAGHLSPEEMTELRQGIGDDWDANEEGARIRFITLPGSGKDYMLYSIRTEADLTLSMVFAGTTPLRVIRQQGQRLIDALASMPEIVEEAPVAETSEAAESAALVPVDESLLNGYSYVWLLRDSDAQLSDAVAQAIIAGLTTQLRELGWKIHTLEVHEDFVYLYAGVPGEAPSHEIIRDLKRRSAEIAHAQNPDLTPQLLWADAYLILAPGRELQTEEILEFINFQRMA
jgi:DNA-binding NarL/FixJ family response regulator